MVDHSRKREDTTPHVAGLGDVASVTSLLVDAFADDPMWSGWAFRDPQTRRARRSAVFRLFVEGALRHDGVCLDSSATSATVWIPPGLTDLSADQEEALDAVLDAGDPADAQRIRQAFTLFERTRPAEPHHYLSLFGTRPDVTGRGHGQRLLAANLDLIDAAGGACYLDTHDGLVPLYERFGFHRIGAFALPHGGPTVNALWRPARTSP